MSDHPASSDSGHQAQFYIADLKHIPSSISSLLSSYSNLPADQQNEHIISVRDRAYESWPYPCLGRWRFLELDLASHPLYHSHILPMLKKEKSEELEWIFLDLGCCLGQDVRKLLFDGADPARVYGADLRPEFIDMGYELFKDQDKFPRDEHFVAPADVFDFSTDSELSKKYDGRVGILHSAAVFHLFSWEEQVKMARRCLQLLTPKDGKVLICGAQVGNINPGEFIRRGRGGGTRFRHDEESWRRLWEGVVQMEPCRDKIRAVDVGAVMESWNSDWHREELGKEDGQGQARPQDGELKQESNTDKKQIGNVEEGYRWMKWWVWIDFA